MNKAIVAIVGRPNVGKSTLFNSLAGGNISIVKDTPGVTRDRIYADVNWLNHTFTLVDTGGIEPESKDIILSQMREQAQIAIDTADVIIFITDVRQGLVDADAKVADMLRRSRKPVVLAVNKVDNFERQMMEVYEFIIWESANRCRSPHPENWGSAICWMRWSSIFRKAGKKRRKKKFPMLRSLESQMWVSLLLSISCWVKTA